MKPCLRRAFSNEAARTILLLTIAVTLGCFAIPQLSELLPFSSWASERLRPALLLAAFASCGFAGSIASNWLGREAVDLAEKRTAVFLGGMLAFALVSMASQFGFLKLGDLGSLAMVEKTWRESYPIAWDGALFFSSLLAFAFYSATRFSEPDIAAKIIFSFSSLLAFAWMISLYDQSGSGGLVFLVFGHHASAFFGPGVEVWRSGELAAPPQYGFLTAAAGGLLRVLLPDASAGISRIEQALWLVWIFAAAIPLAISWAIAKTFGLFERKSNLVGDWRGAALILLPLVLAFACFVWPRIPYPDPYFQSQPGRIWMPALGVLFATLFLAKPANIFRAVLCLAALSPLNVESGFAATAALLAVYFNRRIGQGDLPSAGRLVSAAILRSASVAAVAFLSHKAFFWLFNSGLSTHLVDMPLRDNAFRPLAEIGATRGEWSFSMVGIAALLAGTLFSRPGGPSKSKTTAKREQVSIYLLICGILLEAQHSTRALSVLWLEVPGLFLIPGIFSTILVHFDRFDPASGSDSRSASPMKRQFALATLAFVVSLGLFARPPFSYHYRVPPWTPEMASELDRRWRFLMADPSETLILSDSWWIGHSVNPGRWSSGQIRFAEHGTHPGQRRKAIASIDAEVRVLHFDVTDTSAFPPARDIQEKLVGRPIPDRIPMPSGEERIWTLIPGNGDPPKKTRRTNPLDDARAGIVSNSPDDTP